MNTSTTKKKTLIGWALPRCRSYLFKGREIKFLGVGDDVGVAVGGGGGGGGLRDTRTRIVKSWLLMSCQPHRSMVTS